MVHFPKEIEHSEKYEDDVYEYKHVILPKEIYMAMTKSKLLAEPECRALGINQTKGWVHYSIHKPEPHILFFRRPLGVNPKTGEIPIEVMSRINLYHQRKREWLNQ
jgi:cyclin-dependent kinase regulatory subunit CKS1